MDQVVVDRHGGLEQRRLQVRHGRQFFGKLAHDVVERLDQPRQQVELAHGRSHQKRQQHGAQTQGEAGAQGNLKLDI
ncbi:hypothetical protein [Thiobacillus denitrificans]|uniref:hypothetical protein n=1 Tax=Thiobacillus denitrificans TaxID=36861 RepID=UPI0012FA8D83|nr:hypothetical protein [Thiobacillus denitrificans]